jgi:hypothetical protein
VKSQHLQKGVTLIEAMLVLAIGMMIVMLGFRQVSNFRYESNITTLEANVDQLFLTTAISWKSTCAFLNGTTYTAPTSMPMPNQMGTGIFNPLIDNSSGMGYVVQMNLLSITTPNANCSSQDCGSITPVSLTGSIVQLWVIQVSALIKNASQVATLAAATGADCISSLAPDGRTVSPCTPKPVAGNYLVWSRPPSYTSPETTNSILYASLPQIKEFNLQYTHDQMFELTQKTYIDNGSSGIGGAAGGASQAYYTCGS